MQKKIAAGESFTCPIHKCIVCKQGENKMDPDLQFAICRRCPKSYHRKCLPRYLLIVSTVPILFLNVITNSSVINLTIGLHG